MSDKLSCRNLCVFGVFICFILFAKYFYISLYLLDFIEIRSSVDGDYYHSYAIGLSDYATSIWPVFLKWLNEIGLYNRQVIQVLNFFLSALLTPFLCTFLVKNIKSKVYLFLSVSAYASFFVFSLNLVREPIMFLLFVLALITISSPTIKSISFLRFCLFCILAVIMFFIRPYLGFSLIFSLLVFKFIRLTTRSKFINFCIYMALITIFASLGLFDEIISYRTGFNEGDVGGSSFLIDLSSANFITFPFLYIKSVLFQLFGMYFVNSSAVVLFVIETIPFILLSYFLIRNNDGYNDDFVKFCIIFFISYMTIWCMGNDNLGTAIRLRVPNYLIVMILYFWIKERRNSVDCC